MRSSIKVLHLFLILLLSAGVFVLIESCSVKNDSPEVISVSIEDGARFSEVETLGEITIIFNKNMNRYLTERNILISGYYGGIMYFWSKDGKTCTLKLKESLEEGYDYTLRIQKGCEDVDGYDLGVDKIYHFYTYLNSDDFYVKDTAPADGEIITDIDGITINVIFSCALSYKSIYKILSIEPEFSYTYSFSNDRKTLSLIPVEQLERGVVYTVTLNGDFKALEGRTLGDDYSFSFSTIQSYEDFNLISSNMINPENQDEVLPLNTGYDSKTEGIKKNFNLVLIFNSDFLLNQASRLILIEPAVSYHLEKIGKELIFGFLENMEAGQEYWISIDKSLANTSGILLGQNYRFGWIVNGADSQKPVISRISILNPDVSGVDVVIYDGSEFFQNQAMLLSYSSDHVEVIFQIEFSEEVSLFRVLDSVSLEFQFGNVDAVSGELTGYVLDADGRIVDLTFSLPDLSSGGDGYYRFIVRGGSDGVLDINGNFMENDVEAYVVYEVGG